MVTKKSKPIKRIAKIAKKKVEVVEEPQSEVKVEVKVETPVIKQIVKKGEYKQEIIVNGKKVKRLNGKNDNDKFFHCSVNQGEFTAHFKKELFK